MVEESELGLSLRLQTSTKSQEGLEDDKLEENSDEWTSYPAVQSKIKQTEMAGITGQVATPPNRKSRISVRARCETATVSYNYSLPTFYVHEVRIIKLINN